MSNAKRTFCAKATVAPPKAKKSNFKYYFAGGLLFFGVVCAEDMYNYPDGLLSQSELFPYIVDGLNSLTDSFNDALQPTSDELLPEWPTAPCYAGLNIPAGTPAPPLLIIDVEQTLIATEHDPRYGYRHVKRRGVDKFIEQLSNYYEVVLFCENDIGMMEHVIMAIDKDNRTHKLGPSAGEIRNGGDVLKRLDCMNRDIRRIVLIDDSIISSQLCRRNTILVPPFDDAHDSGQQSDDVLLRLIPVLQALVHDDKLTDFRRVLDDLGGASRPGGGGDKGEHHAEALIEEYQMRVTKHRLGGEQKKNRGLGRLLRGVAMDNSNNNSNNSGISGDPFSESAPSSVSQHTASSVVSADGSVKMTVSKRAAEEGEGKKKAVKKKKGGLFEWLDQREQDKAAEGAVKREEMEALYRGKMEQKQAAAAQKQQQEEENKRQQDVY
jgi:hypothetical protein